MGGKVGKILPLVALAGAGLASGGLGLAADWGKMSALSKIGLGLKGAARVGGLLNGGAVADQQAAMLTLQQGQQNFTDASLALDLSHRALATQQRLRKTLAALNVRSNALGVDLSSGSASNLMDAAFMGAQNDAGRYATQRQMLTQGGRTAGQVYAYKRRAASANRTGAVIGDLLNFGMGAAKTLSKYNPIGRV